MAVPQPSEGVSLAPKIEVDDARIVWTRPATAVDRLVRGCTPAPGAWTTFRGERLKVSPLTVAEPGDVPAAAEPLGAGDLVVTKKAVFVGTGTAATESRCAPTTTTLFGSPPSVSAIT